MKTKSILKALIILTSTLVSASGLANPMSSFPERDFSSIPEGTVVAFTKQIHIPAGSRVVSLGYAQGKEYSYVTETGGEPVTIEVQPSASCDVIVVTSTSDRVLSSSLKNGMALFEVGKVVENRNYAAGTIPMQSMSLKHGNREALKIVCSTQGSIRTMTDLVRRNQLVARVLNQAGIRVQLPFAKEF